MSDTVQRIFQLMEQRHVSAYRVSQETRHQPGPHFRMENRQEQPQARRFRAAGRLFRRIGGLSARPLFRGGFLPRRPARQFARAAYRRGKQGPGAVSCVSPFALWQRKGPGRIMIQSVLTP